MEHGTPFSAEEIRRNNYLGRRIGERRRSAGLSLAELSRALERYGVSIGEKGLSKWETGQTVPNAYQFMAVCGALGWKDPFGDYDPALNDVGLRRLRDYKEDLIASGRYTPHRAMMEYIDMPVYELPVSAGAGVFLDGEVRESLRFPRSSVPAGAEFGLRVSGDSMEPVYQDGQIVWVQPYDRLRLGEVGIFIYDGEGYIKAYGEREPEDPAAFTDSYGTVRRQPVLISYNEKYAPRPVRPDAGFRIVGRVLR